MKLFLVVVVGIAVLSLGRLEGAMSAEGEYQDAICQFNECLFTNKLLPKSSLVAHAEAVGCFARMLAEKGCAVEDLCIFPKILERLNTCDYGCNFLRVMGLFLEALNDLPVKLALAPLLDEDGGHDRIKMYYVSHEQFLGDLKAHARAMTAEKSELVCQLIKCIHPEENVVAVIQSIQQCARSLVDKTRELDTPTIATCFRENDQFAGSITPRMILQGFVFCYGSLSVDDLAAILEFFRQEENRKFCGLLSIIGDFVASVAATLPATSYAQLERLATAPVE